MARSDELPGHAFISYVREDSARVDHVQRALEAAGVRVWRDTADLWPGQDWRAEIRRAVNDNALVFLACFSRNSLAREVSYQNEELALALSQIRLRRPGQSWLIPVRFDEVEVPDVDLGGGRTLASIQSADLFGSKSEEGSARLVEAVLRVLRSRSAAPTSVEPDTSALGASEEPTADLPGLPARPVGPARWGEVVHQMLLAGRQTKSFQVVRPGGELSNLMRKAAARVQLDSGEKMLAAWLDNDGLFSLGTTYWLVFTSSGIRVGSGGSGFYVPYPRFPDFTFQELSETVTVNRHSRAGGPRSEQVRWLAIEGAGHRWASFKSLDWNPSSLLIPHLKAISLLVSEAKRS